MPTERIWRAAAIVVCAAVPASFYVIGDLTDAFPGVLTIAPDPHAVDARPPAQAEEWKATEADAPQGQVAQSVDHVFAVDLARRMDSHASLPVVAGHLAYSVVDAETGEVLAQRDADTARAPASTLKLLTSAAALRRLDPESTLTTRAVYADGRITLVGGGDMTLTEAKLRELATGAAKLAKDAGATTVTLGLDTSYLRGGENPAWGGNGRAGGWVTPTAALAVNEGWLDGTEYGPKSADPAGDAARLFAKLLHEQGLQVRGEPVSAQSPAGAPTVEVHSATIADIVRHTLEISDNTTAELLAHLVARARGEEPTPAHAAAAVEAEVRALADQLGVPKKDLDALVLHDGSGLSVQNRVPPALFAAVLADVASGSTPELEQILYDVPVAGLTGTLVDRFDATGTRGARGLVRGKTGYLGGTASLAGVSVLPDGRTVGFAILVHDFDGARADDARAAVDAVASELVRE